MWPTLRVEQLGILLPFPIDVLRIWEVPDCISGEKRLHEVFKHLKINGEWFALTNKEFVEIDRIYMKGRLLVRSVGKPRLLENKEKDVLFRQSVFDVLEHFNAINTKENRRIAAHIVSDIIKHFNGVDNITRSDVLSVIVKLDATSVRFLPPEEVPAFTLPT